MRVTNGYVNTWNDGYPSGGNYWSDYTGVDEKSGSNQDQLGSDGIGDTPYIMDGNNQDKYPLMKPYPWDPHDIGITSIATSKTVVGQGFDLSINITIFNYGNNTETFNVSVFYGETAITLPDGKNYTTITLPSGNSTTLTIPWNTTGVAKGNYTIKAYATPLPGETDTADNTLTGGTIIVTIPGDVDGDFDVDIYDIVTICAAYGSMEGDPRYVPNCDIDCNGRINIYDVVIACAHYGQKAP